MTAHASAAPGSEPARRRNPRSHRAILNSALAILREEGYRALSMEGVAARAGVGKQTIYRWWPSLAAVVLEALTTDTAERLPTPDTGRVAEDLRRLLVLTVQELSGQGGPVVRGLMAEAQRDAMFAAAWREHFVLHRRAEVRQVLERGVRRGEIDPQADLEVAVDGVYGPVLYRLLVGHASLDTHFAEALATQVLAGICA